MGNMPNRLAGRAAALVLALLLGGAAYLGGRWAGDQLAYGFTFDWYVHAGEAAYDAGHVLAWGAAVAFVAGLLAVFVAGGLTDLVGRALARRARFIAPRRADPASLDVHLVKLSVLLPAGAALLTLLGFYAILALPMLSTDASGVRGEAIERISPEGFSLLMGSAGAFGALVAGYLGSALTFEGILSGRLVRSGTRNVIARVSLFGARNAVATVAVVLVLTLVAGAYAATVTTNVDAADVLPRGDPNTAAAKNLTKTFKSSFTQQVTFQFHVLDVDDDEHMALYARENEEKLPNRADVGNVGHVVEGLRAGQPPERGEPNPANITDELYVRAMEEAIDFFLSQDPFVGSVAGADYYALINWTLADGENAPDEAFAIPDTSPEGELRYQTVKAGVENVGAVYNALDAVASPTWRQTAVLILVDPQDDVTAKEIGRRALEVREAYLQAVEDDPDMYQVFGRDNPPLFSVDLPIANAHASELTENDFKLLLPLIAAFVAITLFIAFRNVASVAVTFTMLTVAVVWTFGAMGYLKIPLNTLNLAVVPLIMGVGIDYGIHMMNEYQEHRAKGDTLEEAWTAAGGGSAFALFVGMLTTVAGLLVMIVSPSLIVAQVGILGTVAMFACYTLAILFVPAAVTLLGERKKTRRPVEFTPSRIMPMLATGLSRGRILVVLVILLLAGSAYASQANLHREAFGDPPRNWLESDPLRQEHERALQGFYDTENDGVKANVIIIEGDLTDPAVHDYINNLTATLRQFNQTGYVDPVTGEQTESRIIADTLKDLPFLVNTWLTVRGGADGAGEFLGAGALGPRFADTPLAAGAGPLDFTQYPSTREEITETLDSMFASPISQFGYLFTDAPDYSMSVIVFSVQAATYPDAEAVWNEVQAAIAANEELRPEGVKTSFFGNTAINYLFVAKQVPWLNLMSIVCNIVVVAIVALSTRNVRTTLVVGTVSSLTTLLWYGLLPQVGIGLAISLTLPVIFISAMGSDYALHLSMRCASTRDTRAAMESVGKGVLFSFVTTIGAFLIFTRISDLAGRRSIVGTVLAIGVVFLVTLLVLPVFYPVKKTKRGGARGVEPARHVPVLEAAHAPAIADGSARTPAAKGGAKDPSTS